MIVYLCRFCNAEKAGGVEIPLPICEREHDRINFEPYMTPMSRTDRVRWMVAVSEFIEEHVDETKWVDGNVVDIDAKHR